MQHNEADGTAHVTDEVAALRAEVEALRAELAEMRNHDDHRRSVITRTRDDERPQLTSRRRLFALAGGAAAAAAAAAVVSNAAPAAANNNDIINVANNETSDSTNVISTFLNYSIPTTNTNARNLFVVGDAGAAFSPVVPAAVAGYAGKTVSIGVLGTLDKPGGGGANPFAAVKAVVTANGNGTSFGVHAVSSAGSAALVGESDTGVDVYARGTGRILLAQAAVAGPPTGTISKGEIARDGNGDIWTAYLGGGAPLWRKLGGGSTAGALHVVTPARVYDSRLAGFGGLIANGESRVVNVSNGIDINTGAVTVANVVPAGATAIQYTFTIAGATTQGFLAVVPGDSVDFSASTINWSASTPNLATGALVKLAPDRTVKVFAGGGGSTHFIVDITGYYL